MIMKRWSWVALVACLAGCGGAALSSPRTIAPDTFAVSFAADRSHAEIEHAARDLCQGKQFCKVLGWTDPSTMASALPMTDRELAALKFSLTINRISGMDEASWS